MGLFGRKTGAAPAEPFNPWRPVPMGSAGDAHEQHITFPLDPEELRAASAPQPKGKKKGAAEVKHLREGEVRFLRYHPPLHPLVIVAWGAVMCAVTSHGPALAARSVFCIVAVLCASIVPVAVRSSSRLVGGTAAATAAGICAVSILAATYVMDRRLLLPFGIEF